MLHLRAFGTTPLMATVAAHLAATDGVRHVTRTHGNDPADELVTAAVDADVADATLAALFELGLAPADFVLTRLDVIAPSTQASAADGIVWAELHGAARANARPIARYLGFMAAAGVIAGFGVLEENTILTVGAMAISPDLLPLTAACTGLVLRRPRLVRRGLATLLVGLCLSGVVAAVMTVVLRSLSLLPEGFEITHAGALEGLTAVSPATVCVALAAGFVGMLATETRASAGVGVAISVTTIPAAAYLGVATGMGEIGKAVGAFGVLSVNVLMLLVGGTLTLAGQRLLQARRRHGAQAQRRSS